MYYKKNCTLSEHSYEDATVRAAQRDVVTYAGQPVRLRCITRERATINWSREGQGLPLNARFEEDYLELPRAKPEDSGRYICQIRTVHGVSSDYINLNVSRKYNKFVDTRFFTLFFQIKFTFISSHLRLVLPNRNKIG